MDDGTKIKKFHNLVFINGGTPTVYDWKQIRKATDNAVTMNAETTEYDYIVDESPTLVLEKYKPGMSLPITMYKGEADYEYFYDKYYNLKTGADAESKILLIDYAHGTSSYNAWLADCVVVIDSMNPVESTITANITMNGNHRSGNRNRDRWRTRIHRRDRNAVRVYCNCPDQRNRSGWGARYV